MSKSFSFSIFLNANKKKQFLQTQIFFTTKINPREITEIWPSVKTNPQKKKMLILAAAKISLREN